jgi:hypothetical protein
LYVSQPDTDYDLNESELSALPDNSIQCIDGVYNTNYPDFFRDELKSRSAIETHLVNDICWYQYLMWNALNCLYINPSLPNIYVNLNKSSWKFHIDLEYNYAEQIFTYLKVHLEATATMHISILPTTTGKIDLDYTWGNPVQSASGELTTGPKLLGGYTVSNVAGREHFPQGYNEDGTSSFNPYTQNFISLVPSELGSYQTFNLNVNSSIMNMTSHPRLYFMSQPRFFGLEYATGEEHLGFSTNASSYGYDSFSN